VKSNTAADDVPTLATMAEVPGDEVVVVPAAIVAAVPVAPVGPIGPVGPVAPVSPRGIVKLRTASNGVPLLVTDALVPAAPVVVVPTFVEAITPNSPGVDQVNAEVVLELTSAIETQISLVGADGGD
jgi:hypothetical protein